MTPKQVRDRLAVLRTMLEEEFPTTRLLDKHSIAFDFAAGPIPIGCYCEINPEAQAFLVRGLFTLPFAPDLRSAVSEYLHRINFPLLVGNWASDLNTGEVRWKLGFYFGDGELSEELMYQAVGASLHFIKRHVPGLVKLSVGRSLDEALGAVGEDHGEGVILPGDDSGKPRAAQHRGDKSRRKGKNGRSRRGR